MAETPDQEAAEQDDEPRPPIGEIPAFYVDTWNVLTWKGHMRITFGEDFSDARYLRSAIVVTLDDAESLGRLMLEMAEKRKKKDEGAK